MLHTLTSTVNKHCTGYYFRLLQDKLITQQSKISWERPF